METRLLKSEEVAEILQVSKAHAYVLMKQGEIPTFGLGKLCASGSKIWNGT